MPGGWVALAEVFVDISATVSFEIVKGVPDTGGVMDVSSVDAGIPTIRMFCTNISQTCDKRKLSETK